MRKIGCFGSAPITGIQEGKWCGYSTDCLCLILVQMSLKVSTWAGKTYVLGVRGGKGQEAQGSVCGTPSLHGAWQCNSLYHSEHCGHLAMGIFVRYGNIRKNTIVSECDLWPTISKSLRAHCARGLQVCVWRGLAWLTRWIWPCVARDR